MTHLADVPPLVAWFVAVLTLAGAAFALIGSIGLLRLRTFYERIHPPTMGTTLGVGCVLLASMLLFSTLAMRPVVHEIVIAVFVVLTTPVTYMLLVRAAIHRDRVAREDAARAGETPRGDRASPRLP